MSEAALLMSASPTLDPEGLENDYNFLIEAGWKESVNTNEGAEFTKAVVQLAVRQSQDNAHRVLWELSVMAEATKVGYAAEVKRPGDLDEETLKALIKKAVKGGEEELKKWTDALAEARRTLGI